MPTTKEMNTLVVGTNEYEIVDSTARSTITTKQDTLVSGTNIKTINNESILGSGNITASGDTNVIETVKVNNTPLTPDANKSVNIDLSGYATTSDLSNKQDTLVSGTNIKTINNNSLLGSGNIDIQAGGSYTAGNGINITNDEISIDDSIVATQTWVQDYINSLDANNTGY